MIRLSPSGEHGSKWGWAERAWQRLQEQLEPLGVELNREKDEMVDMLKGEAFGSLGLTCAACVTTEGGYTIQMTPKKKAERP